MDVKKEYKKEELQSFGLLMAAVFFLIAYVALRRTGPDLVWLVWLGLGFGVLGVIVPSLLSKPYQYWMAGSAAIGKVVNLILMTVLYYVGIGVTALFVKVFRKDPLDRSINKNQQSYWHTLPEIKYDLESMKKQY